MFIEFPCFLLVEVLFFFLRLWENLMVLFFIHCVYVFLVIQNHFSRLELAEKKGSS